MKRSSLWGWENVGSWLAAAEGWMEDIVKSALGGEEERHLEGWDVVRQLHVKVGIELAAMI